MEDKQHLGYTYFARIIATYSYYASHQNLSQWKKMEIRN